MSEQEQTIDLRVLLKVLIEHLIPIIIVTVAAAAIGFSLAKFVIPKEYTSEALMYVENSTNKQEDSTLNINDINVAQKLVNTCQIIFKSNKLLGDLSTALNGEYTAEQLNKMIDVSAVNSTEVLKVSVKAGSPESAYRVASKFTELAKVEFIRVIETGSIRDVDPARMPETHTYPSAARFTLIAALIGLVGTYFVFLVIELLDTKVKPEDDLATLYELPVFAEILDFETAGKSGYKYGKYGRYGKYGGYSRYGGYDTAETEKSESDAKNSNEDSGNDVDKIIDEIGSEGVKKGNGKEK